MYSLVRSGSRPDSLNGERERVRLLLAENVWWRRYWSSGLTLYFKRARQGRQVRDGAPSPVETRTSREAGSVWRTFCLLCCCSVSNRSAPSELVATRPLYYPFPLYFSLYPTPIHLPGVILVSSLIPSCCARVVTCLPVPSIHASIYTVINNILVQINIQPYNIINIQE